MARPKMRHVESSQASSALKQAMEAIANVKIRWKGMALPCMRPDIERTPQYVQ